MLAATQNLPKIPPNPTVFYMPQRQTMAAELALKSSQGQRQLFNKAIGNHRRRFKPDIINAQVARFPIRLTI